jgi:hypothetical protein
MKQKLLLLFISICTLSLSVTSQQTKDAEHIAEAYETAPQLQSLSAITAFFKMSDVRYYDDIINVPAKALDYKGDNKIAANMGAYLGDMVYVMGTSGPKDAYLNYGAAMECAKHVGLEEVFPSIIIERYADKNVSSDSIVELLDQALDNSKKQLSEKDKSEFFDFMLYGNYVEKLYIISALLKKQENKDLSDAANANLRRDLLLYMVKQRKHLDNLYEIMSVYSDNDSYLFRLGQFKSLINKYEDLVNNRDAILKMKPDEMFQAKEVKAIEKQIGIIRDIIIR